MFFEKILLLKISTDTLLDQGHWLQMEMYVERNFTGEIRLNFESFVNDVYYQYLLILNKDSIVFLIIIIFVKY